MSYATCQNSDAGTYDFTVSVTSECNSSLDQTIPLTVEFLTQPKVPPTLQATVPAADGSMFQATGTSTEEHVVPYKGYNLKVFSTAITTGYIYTIKPTFRAKDTY